mgnify:CR=1 FL=1
MPARSTARPSTSPPAEAAELPRASGRVDARPSDVGDALYVASSELHGLGLFAAAPLGEDVVLGRLAGMPTYDEGIHVLWLTDELGLEVTNDFRFINHSSTPNCALTDVEVVTLRAIGVHEELTHDYGWD